MRRWIGLAVAMVAMLGASRVQAQTARTHDGFYLRLGGGPGWFFDSVESDEFNVPGFGSSRAEGSIQGFSVASELSAGYAVTDGLILGGGVFHHWVPDASTTDPELEGDEQDVEYDWDSSMLWMLGPMVDYYFDPNRGLHLQGGLGLGILDLGEANTDAAFFPTLPEQSGTGLVLMAGIGNEWWVSDEWGLGLLGRLMGGFGSGEDANDTEWDHVVVVPAVLLTATMN